MKHVITLATAAAIAALPLAACGDDGDNDVSPEILTEALVAQGLDQELAECISNDLAGQLTADQFNDVALAQTADEVPADLRPVVEEVSTACFLAPD